MTTFKERAIQMSTEVTVHIPTADGKAIAETVKIEVPALKDPATGEIYLTGEALQMIDKVKSRYLGILLPHELKQLRERLNLTQQEMCELLNIGAKSYTRWETGRERPSRSINLLLCALWEGRISITALNSMRRPKSPWPERIENGCLPGRTNMQSLISMRGYADEACCIAA